MAKKTRKRPGPKPTGKGTQVVVRMQPPLLKSLEKFIKEQPGILTRPEAVRIILADALTAYGLLPVDELPPMKRDAN